MAEANSSQPEQTPSPQTTPTAPQEGEHKPAKLAVVAPEVAQPSVVPSSQPLAAPSVVAPAPEGAGLSAQRIAELEATLAAQAKALEALNAQLEAQRQAAESEAARAKAERKLAFLSQVNGGLHSADYASLAPADADVDTPEGKAKLTEWAKMHAALFRGTHGGATMPGQAQPAIVGQTFAGRMIRTLDQILRGE